MRCVMCHRTLTRPPVNGMGPVCARRAGAKPSQALPDPLTEDLFLGVDLDGAELMANERVGAVVDAAIAREIAAMRAAWGRAV